MKKSPMNVSLREIATIIEGVVDGDETLMISALSPIDNIAPNALVFAEGNDNLTIAESSHAAAILVGTHVDRSQKSVIRVHHPFLSFIKLLNHFYPKRQQALGIHPSAVIAEDVVLGKNISVGPHVVIESGGIIGDNCVIKSHVYIGHEVTIGHDTVLQPHVTIYDKTEIGNRVSIHASTVIGSDGFGYLLEDGQHLKVPHVGNVLIEDDVEIGANSVIDRATMGTTVIGEGTKIDNLVQVAHSVKLGKHNILCAFTGIAGSTVTGQHVVCAANVGVSDHVRIDDGVILAARTGVPPKRHLKQGNTYYGTPAKPREKALEHELATSRIPLMRKNLKALTERVGQLAERLESMDK